MRVENLKKALDLGERLGQAKEKLFAWEKAKQNPHIIFVGSVRVDTLISQETKNFFISTISIELHNAVEKLKSQIEQL